jgi:hypothetical protein
VAHSDANCEQRRGGRQRNLQEQRLVAEHEQDAARQYQRRQHRPNPLAPDEGRQCHRGSGAQEQHDKWRLPKQSDEFADKPMGRPQQGQQEQKAQDRKTAEKTHSGSEARKYREDLLVALHPSDVDLHGGAHPREHRLDIGLGGGELCGIA